MQKLVRLLKLKRITLAIIIVFNSCSGINNATLLNSKTFKTNTQRIACLSKEIKSKSNFNDAEFELFNVNGFSNNRPTTVPGASSWDYKFVVKVASSNIDKWTEGLQSTKPPNYNLKWTKK